MAVLVLSVGRDATLLAIRNLILSAAGYHVAAASTPEEFVDKFYSGDFDAVVCGRPVAAGERRLQTPA